MPSVSTGCTCGVQVHAAQEAPNMDHKILSMSLLLIIVMHLAYADTRGSEKKVLQIFHPLLISGVINIGKMTRLTLICFPCISILRYRIDGPP